MADKNRAATLQQRFGFADDDLKTGTHDEIMLWLNENMEHVLSTLFRREEWPSTRWIKGNVAIPPYPGFRVEIDRVDWEDPVTSGPNKFIVGFIDLVVVWRTPHLMQSESGDLRIAMIQEDPVAFEVKSAIPSAGELIRQINMYRQYWHGARWVVVAPDSRFANLLKSQGIEFVKYPS